MFIFVRFFLLRTHTACCKYEATLPYLPLYYSKTVVHAGCHYLISLSLCVCVTFVVFTDCESCTSPIFTNSGFMEAGEYGLTRRVIRLRLGRRSVNLLPVVQRTNAFTNGVVDRPWVVGREFESHVHHENASKRKVNFPVSRISPWVPRDYRRTSE